MIPVWRLFRDRRIERAAYLATAVLTVGVAGERYGWAGGLIGLFALGAAWNLAIFITWMRRGRPREVNHQVELPGVVWVERIMLVVGYGAAAILWLVPVFMFFGVPFIILHDHGVSAPLAVGLAGPIGLTFSALGYWAYKHGYIGLDGD